MKTILFVVALVAASFGWAKEELIPTTPKSKEREAAPNPLRDVAGDMHTAEAKTGDTTQEIEKAIVDKLDILIEAARQQQEKQSKGGQGDAKQRQEEKPQPKPDDAEKKKQEEELAKKQKLEKAQKEAKKAGESPGIGKASGGQATGPLQTDAEEWGKLPPAIRDQLLQTQGEGFPLKYRELLRRYYRMLAKQKE